MRISDWSSDVCSSDLHHNSCVMRGMRHFPAQCIDRTLARGPLTDGPAPALHRSPGRARYCTDTRTDNTPEIEQPKNKSTDDVPDRTSVVEGQSVSVQVDSGGRLINKKKNKHKT